MNWLTNFVKPKLSALVNKKEVPNNLWRNCPNCASMIHHKDLLENQDICTSCNYHFRMSIERRIEILFGKHNFNEINLDSVSSKFNGFILLNERIFRGIENQLYFGLKKK